MDLYKDATSLPEKAEIIRAIADAIGVTIEVNEIDKIVEVRDADGNVVLLYPKPDE